MSGSGRKDSGVGSKTRYSSLNLSQNYKNTSGGHDYKNNPKRGSLQSLGKISTNARRMPGPAQIRSLKSSNDGQDPTIALVPQGGAGWSSKEEEKEKEDPLNYTRKVEKPQNTVVPEGFKTNFPSLEEQEKMSKKEKEELERRQREEEAYDDEPKDSSPSVPPSSRGQQHLRKPPKEPVGGQDPLHYHRGGPPQPGPQPQGLYHQRRVMYRQPLPPRPPVGRYPPHPYQHHQNPQYRHPYPPVPPHHGGYPPPHPQFVDPYSIPPKDRSSKDDKPVSEGSIKVTEDQLEDEEDDGWAGHQEEVDYTKEVVFEDSSDEDSPKKGSKDKADQTISREKQESGKSEKAVLLGDPPLSVEGRGPIQQQYLPPQGAPPYSYHHHPMPPYPTPYPPHGGWFPHYQQPRGQSSSGSDNPMYDDPRGRQPPRAVTSVAGSNVPSVPTHVWESRDQVEWKADSKPSGEGVSDTSQSPVDHLLPSSPDPTAVRNPPKKIMMRDLGDKGEGGCDQYGQRSIGDSGKNTDGNGQKKVVWGGVTAQPTTLPEPELYQRLDSPVETITQPVEEPPLSVLKERIVGQTSKTLYEPEGRESQEKFRKYQRRTSSGPGANDHHTKSKKISRTDSRGSEGEGGVVRSPVDKHMTEDNDPEVFEEEKKKVLIKKTGSDDRVNALLSKSKDNKGWKGDNRRDHYREPLRGHEDKRRGSRNDRDTVQSRPHPSHAKRLKSEEDGDEVSSGKDSKSFSSNKTSNTKSMPTNKRNDDDLEAVGGSNRVKDSTERQDTRGRGGGVMPKRSSHYDTRPDKYERGSAPRQSNRHDVKTPHSKQYDTHSGKYQDSSRGSGKSRKEYMNNQSSSYTENHKGKPFGKPRRREYDDEGDVFDEYQQPSPSPVNDGSQDQYSKQSNDGRTTKYNNRKDTKRPSKQDSIPSRQDSLSKQDPIPSRQDPIPFKQGHKQTRQGPKQSNSEQTSKHDSIPDRDSRQGPIIQDPPLPSIQDSPLPSSQDSRPFKQDPKRDVNSGPTPVEQNIVQIRDGDSHGQDRSKTSRQNRTNFDQKQQPRSEYTKKSINHHSTTIDTKYETKNTPVTSRQDQDEHKNESKPLKDENESKPIPTPVEHKSMKSEGGRKPRHDYGETRQERVDDRQGNKRRFNTRERDDRGRGSRGRGNRWVRGYYDYEDEEHGTTRRSNKRFEDDDEYYPSRTFDKSRRGGGRGRDQRGGRGSRSIWDRNNDGGDGQSKGTSKKEDTKDESKESQKGLHVYDDLDDIDSPSDWENDEIEDKQGKKKASREYEERHQYKGGGGSSRRYGGGNRSYGERTRRNERYPDDGRSQHVKRDNVEVVEDEPLPQDPPTKDSNFEKYDINAHNVVVVDRRNSRSDGEDQSVGGVIEEGFIQVKSKRDKQKDRDEKRKTDRTSKKGDEHSNRHKGFPGRGQEQSTGGKGWGHVQKKTESTPRDGGNGEWPINEGRSAYGAIGDKPSKEKGSSHDDTHKTTNLNTNHGYKLFETADKGKNAPFGFEPPLSNTPRKGERLQAAIDITLPHMAPHFDTERKSSNEQSSPIVTGNNTTSKTQQVSSSENMSGSNNKNKEHVPKHIDDKESSHARVSGFKGDNNKQKKPKNDQKLYTPPAARSDAPKGQRSQSTKQDSSSRPKVHQHDDPREDSMGSIEEDSSHHHGNIKTEEEGEVYLQQHQGIGGGHLTLESTLSGGNVSEITLDPTNNELIKKGQHVLKELSSNKGGGGMNQPGSSTKFGSVSYASALKMKSQVKSLKVDGVILDESTDVANLLSPKLSGGRHGDTESDCASTEYDIIPLHDMLREVVLSHSDENEVDGSGSTHRYTPSSPRQHPDECYPSGGGGGGLPLSPAASTSFTTKPPFPSPASGGGSYTKPSLYGSGAGESGSSFGGEVSSPPSYPPEDHNDNTTPPATARGMVKNQLLKEETRPSSAQSLSDSPLVMRFQKTGFNTLGGGGGSESPSHSGGGQAAATAAAPLTRVSSAPSHLPLSAVKHDEIGDDDTDSVKTDDSISTSSKSVLNIEANEFVPNQLAKKKPTTHHQKGNNTRGSRGGGHGYHHHHHQGHRNSRGGGQQGNHHHKGHNTTVQPHGKPNQGHFRHNPQQPHPQQQSLLNKPPLDMLLQLFLKNVHLLPGHGGLAPPPTPPTIPVSPLQTSQPVPPPPMPPSLPLKYSPMTSGIPYQVAHPPPGVMTTQSRKLSQEGIPPPTPHGMPHPPLPSAPPLQYITTGSKGGISEGGPPTDGPPPPSGAHPPYYSVTPLLPNSTPPQLPQGAAAVIIPHPSQVHHLPSTRPSHAATPINGPPPQVPPLTIIPSLQLTPRPVMVEQPSNSNSRPPLLPTPPGFNLLHQTSAAATPTVMTPSIHHPPTWSINPQATFRMGMPPNIPSHDQASIIQFPHAHMPPAN